MPTLSVVMIVKNEEKWLKSCLDSVKRIADEIVIADTGSDDKSIAIAQSFDAAIHHIVWRNDFAWARNESMKPAKGDWLLLMDADEVLSPQGADQVRKIVDNNGWGKTAFDLIQANYCTHFGNWRWVPVPKDAPLAKGSPGYVASPLTRLFRNHMGFEFRGCVHETINHSILEKGHQIEPTDILIHHYGLNRGEYSLQKSSNYRALCKKKVKQSPGDAKSWMDLATCLAADNSLDDASEAVRTALSLNPSMPDAVFTLTNIYLQQARWKDARKVVSPLLDDSTSRFKAQLVLASIDMYEGKLDESEKRFKEIRGNNTKDALVNLEYARLLDRQGKVELAEKLLVESSAEQPGLEELSRRLSALQLRKDAESLFLDSQAEALRNLVKALALDSKDPFIFNNIGVIFHSMGDAKQAKENFERALLLAPCLSVAKQNLEVLQS